jgi:hypothetical protein
MGQDRNGDSQYNDRPTFATDLSRSSVVATRPALFDMSPTADQTIIPINYDHSDYSRYRIDREKMRENGMARHWPILQTHRLCRVDAAT